MNAFFPFPNTAKPNEKKRIDPKKSAESKKKDVKTKKVAEPKRVAETMMATEPKKAGEARKTTEPKKAGEDEAKEISRPVAVQGKFVTIHYLKCFIKLCEVTIDLMAPLKFFLQRKLH